MGYINGPSYLQTGETGTFEIMDYTGRNGRWEFWFNGELLDEISASNGFNLIIDWTAPDLLPHTGSYAAEFKVFVEFLDDESGDVFVHTLHITPPAPTLISLNKTSIALLETLSVTLAESSEMYYHNLYASVEDNLYLIKSSVAHNAEYEWLVNGALAEYIRSGTSAVMEVYCYTYCDGIYVGMSSAQITVHLAPATVPEISPTVINLGASARIWLTTRAAANYRHRLTWRIAQEAGASVSGEIASDVELQHTWTAPMDLALYFRNKKEFAVDIICETYNYDTLVGTETVSITAVVPNNDTTKPTITSVVLTPVSSLPESFAGLYLERKSKVKVTVNAGSAYSTITSYRTVVNGAALTGNPVTSGFLTTSGELTITGTVTDARGFTNSWSTTIQVLPYTPPRVAPATGQDKVILGRWSTAETAFDDAGTALKILCCRNYSPVISEDIQHNFCALKMRYMQEDAASYSDWVTLLAADNLETDQLDVVISSTEFNATKEYLIQLAVEDTVGEDTILTLRIPAVGCTLHLASGGKAVGIGQYASGEPERIDMGWKVHFNKGAALRTIYEGAEVAVGGEFEGADTVTALQYSLFVIPLGTGSANTLLGILYGGRIYAGFGSNTMIITCGETAMTLYSSTFSLKPSAIYALI